MAKLTHPHTDREVEVPDENAKDWAASGWQPAKTTAKTAEKKEN